MKKTVLLIVFLLVTVCMVSSVSASTSFCSLSVGEYSDVSSILSGNSARWKDVWNYESSGHGVYAVLWKRQGDSITKAKSILYYPGGGGTCAYQGATGAQWQLELNPILLYKDCTANGYLEVY